MRELPQIQDDGLPDCQGCGGCCFFTYGVVLTEEDAARLPDDWMKSIKDPETQYTHRLKVTKTPGYREHCIAFDPATRECTVYEDRPEKCRNFPRGHPCCLGGVQKLKKEWEKHASLNRQTPKDEDPNRRIFV